MKMPFLYTWVAFAILAFLGIRCGQPDSRNDNYTSEENYPMEETANPENFSADPNGYPGRSVAGQEGLERNPADGQDPYGDQSYLGQEQMAGFGTGNETGTKSSPPGHSITFVRYSYFDRETGLPAFSMLMPKGWQVEGGIRWSPNHSLPANLSFRFFNPRGSEELFIFPTQSYFWTNNQMFLMSNPPGTLRFGTPVVSPPDFQTAYDQFVIQSYRRNATGLQKTKWQDLPDLARVASGQAEPGVQAYAQAGKARLLYAENGRDKEEDLFAVQTQYVVELPGGYTTGPYFINYWYLDYIFSFRADRGQLDRASGIMKIMANSYQLNPNWIAKFINVKEMMIQQIMRGIQQIGQISSYIAQAGSQMREDQMNAWYQRQGVMDRIAQKTGDVTLGIERYQDPYSGKEVELSNQYRYAWAGSNGEYILTDEAGFNPNTNQTNTQYQLMENKYP